MSKFNYTEIFFSLQGEGRFKVHQVYFLEPMVVIFVVKNLVEIKMK